MEKVNAFDVHDKDVPAVVYQLMFAMVDLVGNDKWYMIYPSDFLEYDRKAEWAERFKQGLSNCYFNRNEMVKLLANWPTLESAIQQFHDWLRARNVNPEEKLFVKLWW